MIILPRRPTEPGEFFDYLRKLHDLVMQLVPLNSPSARRTVTPRGTFMGSAPQIGGGAATAATPVVVGQLGMVFRGEWHSSLSVNAQDVFIVYSGANAGIYLATEAQNPGGAEPGTGGFYVKTGDLKEPPGLWI